MRRNKSNAKTGRSSASGAAWRPLDAEVVGDALSESLLRFTALVQSRWTGTDITVKP